MEKDGRSISVREYKRVVEEYGKMDSKTQKEYVRMKEAPSTDPVEQQSSFHRPCRTTVPIPHTLSNNSPLPQTLLTNNPPFHRTNQTTAPLPKTLSNSPLSTDLVEEQSPFHKHHPQPTTPTHHVCMYKEGSAY